MTEANTITWPSITEPNDQLGLIQWDRTNDYEAIARAVVPRSGVSSPANTNYSSHLDTASGTFRVRSRPRS